MTEGGITVGLNPAIKQGTRTGCVNLCERIRFSYRHRKGRRIWIGRYTSFRLDKDSIRSFPP